MTLRITVTVSPDIPAQPGGPGGFLPTSFNDMIHKEIQLPGLDPLWVHTLIDATVARDRGTAELTVHSTPRPSVALDKHLRVTTWQPAAHVRYHDEHGGELGTTKLDAPLSPGQLVEVGGRAYRVHPDTHWPGRDPDTGACRGDIDWQHVTLTPEPRASHLPVPAGAS